MQLLFFPAEKKGNRTPFAMPAFCTCLILVLLAFLSAGCGSGAPKLSSADLKAFDKAPAELKQRWEKAVAADKSRDYLTASVSYAALLRESLDPAQSAAVQTAIAALNTRMYEAAEKGDPNAQKAVQAQRGGR